MLTSSAKDSDGTKSLRTEKNSTANKTFRAWREFGIKNNNKMITDTEKAFNRTETLFEARGISVFPKPALRSN